MTMDISRPRAALLGGTAVLVCLAAQPALAATPADAQSKTAGNVTTVGDVVVTSRRFSEKLQNVPSSVSVQTAAQLEVVKPRTLEDLSGFAPNVEIGRAGAGAGTSAIYIRGLGYSDVEKGQNPAVGLVVDDVVIGTNFGQLLDPFDVAQVEVDRGPAGIFYGKNTTAGVINVHRTRPTHAWGLAVDLGGGDYGQFVGKFTANAPVGSTAGVKLSVSEQTRDGFLNNIYTHNTHYGHNQLTNANLQLDWNITPDLDALFSVTESYQEGQGTPVALGNPATEKLFQMLNVPLAFNKYGSPYIPGVTVPLGPWQVANDFEDRNYLNQQIYSLNLTWNSKIGQFVAITAYLNEEDDADQDFDGSCGYSELHGPCPVLANPLLPFLHTSRPQKYTQITEEVRFTHDFGSAVKFLAGVYYFHHDISAYQSTRTAAPGVPVTAPLTDQISGQHNDSESVFANVIYNVTSKLHVAGGFRYINESTAFHNAFDLLYYPNVGPIDVPLLPSFKESKSFSHVLSKFSIDYALTDNNMLYASRSEGFRSGGFSPRSTLSESVPGQTNYSPGANYSAFKPESDVSYEIGSKNTFFDGQLILNVDGFFNQDTDHQGTEVVLTGTYGPGTNTYIVNIPKVEIKGAEIEATLRPHAVPGLTLSAVGGWQDARITDGKVPGVEAPYNPDATAGAPGTVYDLTGTPLERVPNYSFTLRGDYIFHVGPGDMELNLGYRWTDQYVFATVAGIPDIQPAFGLLDASASYSWDRYKLIVSAKNLTNQVYRSNSLPSVFFQGWGDPRTVLVELQAHF